MNLVAVLLLSFTGPQYSVTYECDVLEVTIVHHSETWTMRYLMWYDYIPAERSFVMRACSIHYQDSEVFYHDGKWTVRRVLSSGPIIVIRSLKLQHVELWFDPEVDDRRCYGGMYRWVFRPDIFTK